MVDHAKLPNLVIVAVLVLIYFWIKMKAFQPLEGRHWMAMMVKVFDTLNARGFLREEP